MILLFLCDVNSFRQVCTQIQVRVLGEILSKWVGKAGGHPQLALVASIAPVQPFPKFDRFIFRRAMDVACPSSIDRLQLVCFVKGNSLFPLTIPSAERNPLDHSRLRRATSFPPLRASKRSIYLIRERWVGCQRRLAA